MSRDIGGLRERVTVQQATDTGAGPEKTRTWAAITNGTRISAEVLPASAQERLALQAVGSQVVYRVRIRYRTDITPALRIVWHAKGGDKTLHIHGVTNPDGRKHYLRVDCGEVV